MSVDVSVIIPVYNAEKYIYQCLDSVFNQTYKNIEVIIINDGSQDKSKEIILQIIDKYKNVVYIEQENQGLSVSRNKGLSIVKGRYILFLDSDDYLDINSIKLLYEKAINTDSDMVIMGHKKVYDYKHKYEELIPINVDEDKIYKGKDICEMMLNRKIQGYAWDKFIKTEKINKSELYFEPKRYIEDLYPMFKLVYNCEKITFVNKPLYNYRQVMSSISNKRNEKIINDYIYAHDKVLDFIKEKNEFNSESIFYFKYGAFRTIISMINIYYKHSYKIYNYFNSKNLKHYEPKIKDLVRSTNIRVISKIDAFLWKFKVYNIFMPYLINFKNYLKYVLRKD